MEGECVEVGKPKAWEEGSLDAIRIIDLLPADREAEARRIPGEDAEIHEAVLDGYRVLVHAEGEEVGARKAGLERPLAPEGEPDFGPEPFLRAIGQVEGHEGRPVQEVAMEVDAVLVRSLLHGECRAAVAVLEIGAEAISEAGGIIGRAGFAGRSGSVGRQSLLAGEDRDNGQGQGRRACEPERLHLTSPRRNLPPIVME